ncbi:Pentatricopeptide repeat-containing protein [Apostasia shenzhenica]|uniref:Pentatricopeptide repeat-containing protein n=1 Tax=Apostasia shenzhenica TaxID=1088818 RepID=A0A2I0AY28_9ASPA|nr:Pentatricopeptide repeat-containing protein [Apostasia shenzhenica]
MVRDGTLRPSPPPPEISYPRCRYLLRSCALGRSSPALGRCLQAALIKAGILLSGISSNISGALFHMYAAVGPPSAAVRSFHEIPISDLSPVDWTALISCHVRQALPDRAIHIFRSMLRDGFFPDEVTLLCVLSAAARLSCITAGSSAHLFIVKLGLPFTVPARNAAMDMYGKCFQMADARRVLAETPDPNVVSWTIILAGSLCCEGITSGQEVFDQMPERNEVSWAIMAASYVESGLPREALALLANMLFFPKDSTIRRLNHVSFCTLLSACSQAGNLAVGQWLHATSLKTDLSESHHLLVVNTALLDMYAKCGRIDLAHLLFDEMPERNLVTWNAMLSGFSMHGMCSEALILFSAMAEEALRPDDITFVSLLSACSRSGDVDNGRRLFRELGSVYGLTPKVEHLACMVDLLGRAGHLEEAERLIRKMAIPPNEVVLGSLIASCSLHGKLELVEKLLPELMAMNPDSREYHVLLSNMYLSHGRPAEADELRRQMKKNNKEQKKGPGMSYIEINGDVHRFSAGDKTHAQTENIYAKLDEIARRLQAAGYSPDAASQAPHSVNECLENGEEREEREQALLSHSERIAVAFGLISTKPGMPLRVFKNLRICCDCHSAMKLISKVYERDIIVRDRNRFHRFSHGVCSCSDYW